ncbi:GDP/GTP exchange factor Sec2p [Teratosphaeria destructans]|uniref:GDP/GTP exchange factor Sec2p n=1 Tax=Teratosphaeria destructans TaxID=418781 RepID=A0A9W7SZJ8_9PEZI|nr:GDP/GTP exchange factor Sec2p [Teratosphaeria destructans]
MSWGTASSDEASKVRELEAEVESLADKANNASQRFAEYENEIRVLNARLRQQQRRDDKEDPVDAGQGASQSDKPGISRFGSFMHSRKVSPMMSAASAASSREKELEAALVKEQTARIAAEKKVKEVNAEIEELSASLFQQANEMVAAERKENAALRDKVEMLEKQALEFCGTGRGSEEEVWKENARLKERIKTMEQREIERRRRLEKIEAAQRRVERARSLLIPR